MIKDYVLDLNSIVSTSTIRRMWQPTSLLHDVCQLTCRTSTTDLTFCFVLSLTPEIFTTWGKNNNNNNTQSYLSESPSAVGTLRDDLLPEQSFRFEHSAQLASCHIVETGFRQCQYRHVG